MRDVNHRVIGFELLGFLAPGDQGGFSGEVEVQAQTYDQPA